MEYSSIFNKNLYSLLINNNEVKILYKNELADLSNIDDDCKLILNKFINKDLSVRNDCINIPIFINKLFEIVCNKDGKFEKELKNPSESKDIMFEEILNNINDIEKERLKKFCDGINITDKATNEKEEAIRFVKNILENFEGFPKIAKIYLVYRMYNYLNKNKSFVYNHTQFRITTIGKINDFEKEIEKFNNFIIYNKIKESFKDFRESFEEKN
jgi:hypothetical protein